MSRAEGRYIFDWVEEHGACPSMRRMFDSTSPATVDRCRGICRRCVVVEDCMARAMAMPELEGTWAATTAAERVVLRSALEVSVRSVACGKMPSSNAL